MCGIPSIYFPSECLSHTVGPRSRGNVSGSAAIDTVWIRTNRPCLSYFRPHRGVAELLFAGRLFPPVSKLGYRLRKYGYFGYYNVNENGSRKVLCTADGMNEDRESGLMCSGSMDDVDKTEHFLPETNNHPTLSIPHSGFCPLNGASIGPSLAALPFSATAAFPYIVCSISYFLLSCKMRLLHIGRKKEKVVNLCTTFKMTLQIMKK